MPCLGSGEPLLRTEASAVPVPPPGSCSTQAPERLHRHHAPSRCARPNPPPTAQLVAHCRHYPAQRQIAQRQRLRVDVDPIIVESRDDVHAGARSHQGI